VETEVGARIAPSTSLPFRLAAYRPQDKALSAKSAVDQDICVAVAIAGDRLKCRIAVTWERMNELDCVSLAEPQGGGDQQAEVNITSLTGMAPFVTGVSAVKRSLD
jgi:hypothetical protein